MKLKITLFAKFLLFMLALAFVPAVVVGLRTISINREGMQAAILELHTHLATTLADSVSTHLAAMDRELRYIRQTLSAQMTWSDRQAVLQALMDSNDNFAFISIVDRKGQELLKAYNPSLEKNPTLTVLNGNTAFAAFWQHPAASSISPVYYADGTPRIDIIYPLTSDHCLYAAVSLAPLWKTVEQTRIGSTGYAFLVNKAGEIIAHQDTALAQNKASAAELPIVQQVIKAETTGSSDYTHPKTGKQIVGAYAPVKGLPWGVVIQQDKAEAFISVYRMQQQAGVVVLLSLGFAGLLAFFFARGLTRPLNLLTDAAKRIAAKDFSARVHIKTHDELRDLAETFNQMTTELDRYDAMQVDKIIEEKTKTESVIYSIDDGLIMTDNNAALQLANAQAREILNLPADGWQGRPLWDFLQNSACRRAFEETLRNPTPGAHREINLSTDELTRYYLLSSGNVVTPNKKESIGTVTVLRNITLEKELDKMKDDFLHSITHDLRNPMTSIRGFLKFLTDGVAGPVTPQQRKMLDTMDRASHRLLVLINDILDIAKLEAGRLVLSLADADLNILAQKNLEIAEGLALKKAIHLKLDVPDHPVTIACDAEFIERVFSNLISNALKFTPENGCVTVRIREQETCIEAAVIDTGEGIPFEYTQKIFDKFQQIAGQHKGGTGLGLTICKHIVEAHLGTIRVESKLGEGSSFIFTLPRHLTADRLMTAAESQPHS